ncbi:glycosyltransferase family 8 protein [Labilibacter marinus]|uniref:glycosyltransferase family 8 protein n=1 Tax=Labilibacter marinus TaxID=1477105 RepID=UPI000AB77EFD|nr:glycosyltransferase family 8 protein [Labilibacter marinus]
MHIPIVFSFNDKYTIPAGVCITSLLSTAFKNNFYEIHILYGQNRLNQANQKKIKQLEKEYSNCAISFVSVNNKFNNAYEIRDVSLDTYFRLLIPSIFAAHSRVIYCDVDIIFKKDISGLLKTNLTNKCIAGVKEYPNSILHPKVKRHISKLDLEASKYINAGVLIFNNDIINSHKNYETLINSHMKRKFKYQDQDILNIIFKNEIKFLPDSYNYNYNSIEQGINIIDPHIIHYTLQKPWNQPKLFSQYWWDNYANSIFYDEKFYFSHIKENYSYFDIVINLGRRLNKIGLFHLYRFLQRFSKS